MTIQDAENIKKVLARMRQEDPEYRVFGSDVHKYKLGASLSEEELSEFEQRYAITLPEDYRFFLKEVGDGGARRSTAPFVAINCGAGPAYGLFPLKQAVEGSDLLQPFPLVPVEIGKPVEGDGQWGDDKPFPGLLEIAYGGCANFSYLVVNGPSYGTVWKANLDLQNYYSTGLSFEAWYRRWVDMLVEKAIPMLAHEQVVKQIQIGMTKAEVISICGGSWKQRDFGERRHLLRFAHLATEFELDENGEVNRIVNLPIVLGKV